MKFIAGNACEETQREKEKLEEPSDHSTCLTPVNEGGKKGPVETS